MSDSVDGRAPLRIAAEHEAGDWGVGAQARKHRPWRRSPSADGGSRDAMVVLIKPPSVCSIHHINSALTISHSRRAHLAISHAGRGVALGAQVQHLEVDEEALRRALQALTWQHSRSNRIQCKSERKGGSAVSEGIEGFQTVS